MLERWRRARTWREVVGTGNEAMKTIGSELIAFARRPETRHNVRALLRYLALLAAVIAVYAVLFRVIMVHVEGREYSWFTGVYWTLTVMSTLGFGDITFETDLGRLFSTIVLLTGMVLLLIVLPFLFIRYFYAPWLEEQIRRRAQPPNAVPPGTRGHVVVVKYDSVAAGLIDRLGSLGVPCYVLEGDPETARRLYADGVPVVLGSVDSRATYEAVRVKDAALVLANGEDTTNTNATLTVREVAPEVPVAAIANDEDAVDNLELTGATYVLPLKKQLGEQLANRVSAGMFRAHVIGRYRDLLIAEFPAQHTPLVGRTIRDTNLRAATGVTVVGLWDRGVLRPVDPDMVLTPTSVPVVVGTERQIEALNELLAIYDGKDDLVLVIGGGKVGRAATAALRRMDVRVHMIERNEALRDRLEGLPDLLVIGDASDRRVLERAGLDEARSVILTTHDDAMNIYLAVYCRRLNPEVRIVSRITHQRNMESIHRAGADLVLGYDTLAIESVLSIIQGRELAVVGGEAQLHIVPLPKSLEGRTLAESGIGAQTGMTVIAIEKNGRTVTNPHPGSRLEPGSELVMIGSDEQMARFEEVFG